MIQRAIHNHTTYTHTLHTTDILKRLGDDNWRRGSDISGSVRIPPTQHLSTKHQLRGRKNYVVVSAHICDTASTNKRYRVIGVEKESRLI